MYLKRIIIIKLLIIACSIHAIAQTTNYTKPKKKSKFAVYAGFGPNYYFNNLALGKSYINDFNYSFTGRVMWEPEHLLSLGIESGYYRLYTIILRSPIRFILQILLSRYRSWSLCGFYKTSTLILLWGKLYCLTRSILKILVTLAHPVFQ